MSGNRYQELNPQGTYQGIDPHWNQPGVNLDNALARIARALEGIEAELRSKRAQGFQSIPQGTTQT
jgi:hypothetical protein